MHMTHLFKRTVTKLYFFALLFLLQFTPVFAGNPGPPGDPDGGSGQIVNPLKSETILEFILKVIDVLLIFAVPIIILFIMYAGFLFVTARGNEEQIKKARRALLWAVVGGVIALGARLIIGVLENTIAAF